MSEAIQKRDRGITLIELLVVMVIIAMFATLVGSRLFRNVEKAHQATAKEQISEFESTLDLFRLDVGRYPTTAEGLDALRVKPSGLENWDGPYLKKDVPPDPWGHAYIYRCPGQHGDFDLFSYGADGQEGGDGDGADVKNWK
ncbi:MAG TPA: type II secretion system major pseudopilin GspG [Terriglobia bacterium]|jgi:general secretion pathway protein G